MKKIITILLITFSIKSSFSQTYLPLSAGSGNALTNTLYGNSPRIFRSENSTTTQYGYGQFANSGGTLNLGIEGSTGSSLFSNSSAYASVFGTDANRSVEFATNNLIRQVIDGSGKVGFGTLSPYEKVEVAGNLRLNSRSTAASGEVDVLSFQKQHPSAGFGYNYVLGEIKSFTTDGYSGGLNFYTGRNLGGGSYASGFAMSINNQGNLGVGTLNPAEKVDVSGNLRINSRNTNTTGEVDALSFYKQHPSAGPGYDYALAEIKSFTDGGYSGGLNFYTGRNIGGGSYASTFAMTINSSGNIGVGTTTPNEKLTVNGKIRAQEIKVESSPWPDYVFESSYQLTDLEETEQFIKQHKHLPGIPSAKEVEKDGINLGEMNAKLLQKVEELTLHLINQNKKAEAQNEKIERQDELIKGLSAQLAKVLQQLEK